MKNQTTKERITSKGITGNKKRNTGNRQVNRITLVKFKGKKKVNVKAASRANKNEMMEFYPPETLKTCKDLKAICIKIHKLEKEKQKLIFIILKAVPKPVSS